MEKKHAKTPKEKRRNMEKRKEKSRDAARTRRGKETEIFTDLSSLLPLPAAKVAHLDKASVIRVAISYLKVRTVIHSMPIKQERQIEIEGCNMDSLFVDSLEGFLLVATTDGDIMFISDSVNRYLGLQQVEILGQSIFELSHPCDHAEIKEMLSPKDVDVQKSFFLRMKWNPKGRSVNVNKSTQYKVIHYTGRVVRTEFAHLKEEINNNKSSTSKTSNGSIPVMNNAPAFHFVGIGEAIWHPANIEVPLGRNTFLSKHSLDMKYTYADERIVEFFGYDPDTLITKSIYDYHHAQDTNVIKNCFKNLFEKGQSQTERYRFLALGGGYAWVVTQSTLIYNNNQKPLSVVCVNFIVSEIENKNEIYSLCQLDTNATCAPLTTSSESPLVASVNAAVAVASPAALSPVADNAAAAVAPTDYIYDSPQHLIEKLDLNAVASASNTSRYARPQPSAVISNAAAKSRYATLSPATDSQRSSRQSAKKKTPKSKHLTPLPALNLEELLGQSSPPRSGCATESDSAYSSSADASPQQTLGEWLMNDDCEVSPSLYDLTDTDAEPIELSIAESQIKIENIKLNETPGNDTQVLNEVSEIPKPATVNVFVPFTEEMNKGFLGFAEDDTGLTMLKEDPEDLTHLAPTAGDVCVPLDDDHIDYVLPDMLEDIMFSDCNLLSSDTDKDLESSPNSFFSYRDDLEPSSRPLSPILTQTEDCSIPSFCSDDSSLHENSVTHFLDFGLINATDDIDDLSGKSTYIPLTLDQDPLLPFVTNDFMWGSSSGESSTWSSVPSSPTSNCSLSPRLDHTSSLAKLLKAEPICNYDGGGDDQRVSLNGHANVGANTTKHAANFGHNVNSLADRNYSNVSNFKTVAYHRNANAITEIKRRTNSTVRKEMSNNRVDDRRKNAAHVTVGSKRPLSENSWGRGANSCKRSKQTSRTIIVHGASAGAGNGLANGAGVGGTRRIQESAAMAEATAATAKQTNSVLMNLLVSGCDLNAGYDEDFKESNTKRATNAYSTTTTTNKNLTPRINNYQAKKNAGIVNPSNSKCWSTFRKKPGTLFNSENSHIPSLMDLTEQDYAVNAPSAGELLQGSDLLKALECTSIKI